MDGLLRRIGRLAWVPLRDRLHARLAPGVLAEVERLVGPRMEGVRMELDALRAMVEATRDDARTVDARIASAHADRLFLPALDAPSLADDAPFLQHSTCCASDFTHPRYHAICRMLHGNPVWHRKQWEWVFIIHHLIDAGVLAEGSRGVGFGVGTEPLPALFAGLGAAVVATDAPDDVAGWGMSEQHSRGRDKLRAPWLVADDAFDRLVSHRGVDMRAIPDDLAGFDFAWSSCCFEHLGSLQAGMDFVVNSVEQCLKVGGVAVHTTEFNMGSNDDTATEGVTVIYRRRDIEGLLDRLRERGHEVLPLSIGPAAHHLDGHVDVPPYASSPHLKLQLAGFVATSVGLVIRRGR